MPTCKSWKPKTHPKHETPELPGTCNGCWTVCRNKVSSGSNRCDECTALILNHPDSRVRRALIREDGIDETVLIQLSADPDFSVALAAETRLEQLDEDSQNTTHTGADPWANL